MKEICYSGQAKNLIGQLDRLYKHNRQGSYKTRTRYYEAMKRFCVYLAHEFHLQRLANIGEKHIEDYVEFIYEKNLQISYIKTELSTIRFWHDQIPNARHSIPSNDELNLEQRNFCEKERAWIHGEFNQMLGLCGIFGYVDYSAMLCLGWYAGLRIHECFRIDTATANKAIKTGKITIKGKGGLIRTIPINESIKFCLKEMIQRTKRGQKLFVPEGTTTDEAIQRLQHFLLYHRDRIRSDDNNPLTFHGLRHSYACNQYKAFIDEGYGELEAQKAVSKLLGHRRSDVTKIYLTSLKRLEECDE